jgi:hypothetical protein
MPESPETDVLAIFRHLLMRKRTLALLEPTTTQLVRMLAGFGPNWHETHAHSFDQPYREVSSQCSRQTCGAQRDEPGGILYATLSLSR